MIIFGNEKKFQAKGLKGLDSHIVMLTWTVIEKHLFTFADNK